MYSIQSFDTIVESIVVNHCILFIDHCVIRHHSVDIDLNHSFGIHCYCCCLIPIVPEARYSKVFIDYSIVDTVTCSIPTLPRWHSVHSFWWSCLTIHWYSLLLLVFIDDIHSNPFVFDHYLLSDYCYSVHSVLSFILIFPHCPVLVFIHCASFIYSTSFIFYLSFIHCCIHSK